MGIINDKPNVSAESKDVQKSDKPLKPCCACPETKKARDDWYVYILNIYKQYKTITIFLLKKYL